VHSLWDSSFLLCLVCGHDAISMGDSLIQDADGIKAGINSLRNNVKSLESQQKQALFAITQDQTNKSSQEIQRLTDDTNTLIHKVKSQIDALRRSADATGDHMRHNMAETLAGKFAEVLTQYQKAQTEYANKVKAKMAQKVRIVKPDATEEQIENAIESGQVDQMFVQSTLDQNYLTAQAKNALAYVQDRHRDIVAIEASVKELNQLFVDMAIMVESQGVILGHVEDNVNASILSTKSGTDKLRDTVKIQKKSRKKMYIIIIILVILVVVILGGSLGTIKR